MNTVTETKTKFSENTYFVVGTKSINLLSGVTSLGLGLIKINKNKQICFTIDNTKTNNTQKEETKINETKICSALLKHIIEKHRKLF